VAAGFTKYNYTFTGLNGVTSRKTTVFMVTNVYRYVPFES